MKFRLPLLVLATFISFSAFCQKDSLIINGKIINLDGQLYRQASFVTVSRNNIFQPSSEIVHQAPLQADGSYRLAIPLNYQTEEFFLEYGGMTNATFIGEKGIAGITFNADSIGKAKRLFYFSGVLAAANNQYFSYLEEERNAFSKNKKFGDDFFKTFWSNNPDQAQKEIEARKDFRLGILNSIAQKQGQLSPDLKFWITSKISDEAQTIWLDYVLENRMQNRFPAINVANISLAPMTPDKVLLSEKYFDYTQSKLEEIKFTNPGKYESLPVKKTAKLILDYNDRLTDAEKQRLNYLINDEVKDRQEINFLNDLFARNEAELNMLFDFERYKRMTSQEFATNSTEFLNAKYLTKRFFTFSQKQIKQLGEHISKEITNKSISYSFNEILNFELRDSANIQKLINADITKETPTEVLPGYYISGSMERGSNWLKSVLKYYAGKTIYVIKWNLEDRGSLDNLEYVPFLKNQVPANVVFLYLHLVENDQNLGISNLAKKYIVRHNLQGTHMFANSSQTLDLLFKLNPLESNTYAIIRPNGKFLDKNAPSPNESEKLIPMLLNAGR